MSQGNARETQPPTATTRKPSSDGANGSSTSKPFKGLVRKTQKLLTNNHVYSFDRFGKKKRGASEDPTVNTMPVGTIRSLNEDHQPDTSSELQGRKEQRPRANITQASTESCQNTENIQLLPGNRQRITPGENGTTGEFPLVEEYQKSMDVNNAITTAAAHSHEPKESSQPLQIQIKPQRCPPLPPSQSNRVTLPDNHMRPTQMATVDPFIGTEDITPKQSLQSSLVEEMKKSMSIKFPSAEAHQGSRDANNATTSGASHSQEPKESPQELPEKEKPKVAPRPAPPRPLMRVTSRDESINVPLLATVDPFIGTEDITPKQSLQSSLLEEMKKSRKFPSEEAHQSRDANNATTSGASHSQEPKESPQELPEKEKPKVAPRPAPPRPLMRVTSRDESINVPLLATVDPFIGTEDITPKQSLQSSLLEEMKNSISRKFSSAEAHQSRDANNATTSGASHSQEPKENPQELPEKEKPKVAPRPPAPRPLMRVTSRDETINVTLMDVGDPSIGTEDIAPKQSLQSSLLEEMKKSRTFPSEEAHQSRDANNATTSGALQSQEPKESSQELPEKEKSKVAPRPPPPRPLMRVTSRDESINVPLMDVGDPSIGTEDIAPKHNLQSLLLEEIKKSRKFPLAEAHQSRDANNATTSEASHLHKPKESPQELPEMAEPRTAPRNPPPPPPQHPPENVTPRDKSMKATQVVIDDKSTGMEDIAPKQSLQCCAEDIENSTKITFPLAEAHQSRDVNNASPTGGEHSNEPKESYQKEKPKVPSRTLPLPPPPPVRGPSRDKLMNTIPMAKGDKPRTEDSPPTPTLLSSSHGPKVSLQHLGKTKPPRPSRPPPVKNTTSTEKPVNATQMVKGGTLRGTEDSHPKHTRPPSSFDASQVLVLSWDLGHEATNVSSYLMGDQNHDCPCVSLSPVKKDSEWTSLVDQSSIVIFYSTPKSQKPLHRMGRHLEYCIRKKGAEKVIAVIGDADNLEEEWTTKWKESQFPQILQQLQISKAELDWINRKGIHRKIEEIRNSLMFHTGPPTGRKQMSQPTVGFLSWSPKDDSQWLLKLLRPPYFRDMVENIIHVHVDKNEDEKIMEQIFNVPSLILHFTQESFCTFSSQPDSSDRLRLYCEKKEKIIVVIDDLDGKNSELALKELYKKSNMERMSSDLFMFRKEEKEMNHPTHLTGEEPDNKEAEAKRNLFRDAINRSVKLPDPPRPKLGKVGIFSRSSQTDYEWLEPLLRSADLGVEEVRPVYISNKGYAEFYEELTHCDFGILYHTKNRGRVNITNVNDSLYDTEIEDLSTALGRYKVLVVIDDLQDSSWRTKNRILKFQYSIPKYARNMLLVSEEEKKKGENEGKLLTKLIEIIVSPAVDEEGPWETDGHDPETNNPETLTNKNDPEETSDRDSPKTSDTEIGGFTDLQNIS